MQAAGADAGAGGGAGGVDNGRDGHDCLGGRGGPGFPGSAGAACLAPTARAGARRRRCFQDSKAGKPNTRIVSYANGRALCVPFPSGLEAEIAYGSLAPDAEPHGGAVEKQLTVSGSVMAVRWRAKDPRLLRISIMTFLDQLSLVMQTMRRFGPPVSR
ncbi:EKC/KEOPS complex subunit LAGE3 [Mirounga angustirostris]|uniref:EKC/KEOPS complex subunit LAGE3 n=1 Tax=Mirounga angustirostris TaxID=9716 RepID=UPI001E689231